MEGEKLEGNKKMEKNSFEINVLELIIYICKKAVWIFLISLVVAFGISGAKYMSDKAKYTSGQENQNDSYQSQQYELNLEHLRFYKEAYESRKEYERESILMSLDSYNINVASIDFFVETKEEQIVDIMTAFSVYGNEGGLVEDIYKKNNEIGEKYLYEIVKIVCSTYENYGSSSVMNVRIYGKTKEQCQQLASLVRESLVEYSNQLNEIGIENNIKECNESYFMDKDGNIFSIQTNFIKSLQEIEEQIAILEQENALFAAQGVIPSSQIGASDAVANVSFSGKYFIIGLALGLIVAVCIFAFKFILSGKVKYATEVSEVKEIDYIGSIQMSKKSNEQLNKLTHRIKWTCDFYNTDNISVVGQFTKYEADVQELLDARINKHGVNGKIIGDIVSDIDAMNKLSAGDNVIIAIVENESSYTYINSLIENCALKKATVMGYIYFRS